RRANGRWMWTQPQRRACWKGTRSFSEVLSGATHRREGHRARLEAEGAQVLEAFGDAGDGILGFVVLDEVVLDASFAGIGEDVLPVDDATANFGHIGDGLRCGVHATLNGARIEELGHVLDVNHREAARIFVEVRDRIGAALIDPAEVQLHGYEL